MQKNAIISSIMIVQKSKWNERLWYETSMWTNLHVLLFSVHNFYIIQYSDILL